MYLDDLEVGQKFYSEKYKITKEEIFRFASQFDPQSFHLDEEAAKDTLFQGLAASGWHTASITMKLLTEGGGLPFSTGIIGAGGEIKWPIATRPDDELMVESTIQEIHLSKSKPDRGRVLVECQTKNQNGETVQLLLASLVVFKKG